MHACQNLIHLAMQLTCHVNSVFFGLVDCCHISHLWSSFPALISTQPALHDFGLKEAQITLLSERHLGSCKLHGATM